MMDSISSSRSTQDQLALFQRLFSGLPDVYGTYDPQTGRAWQVKAPVTREVLLAHLIGRQPYGVYLLTGEMTRAVVADLDDEDLNPPMEFVAAARHYGIPAYVERSKSKGYHAWVFFGESGAPASKARLVVHHILGEIQKPRSEIFPKQDAIDPTVTCGNFINAPLFGRLVSRGRTVFVDADDPTRPSPDQWAFLEQVQCVSVSTLDEIIELNGLHSSPTSGLVVPQPEQAGRERVFGLPPCARRMLSEGVEEDQRVSCFRLGVHLKRAGLPLDAAVAALTHWALKNRPRPGKRIITPTEIADQVRSAYGRDYRACGCEEPIVARYCSPACPLSGRIRARQNRDVQAELGGNAACEQREGELP